DVPALSNRIYHIDSFILEAPKSAIFVGLQNDFMCNYAYNLAEQLPTAHSDGSQSMNEPRLNGLRTETANFDSSSDSNTPPKLGEQAQTCDGYDCSYESDYRCHGRGGADTEEEHALEDPPPEEEDQEYDDGIGFSCDSDSLTMPDDDEFVLVAGPCAANNSSPSGSSSMHCSSGSGSGSSGHTATVSSYTSLELDIMLPALTPPPPPMLAKPKSSTNPLKFLHKII
ncbi:Hypothetical predicted protein, partial [Drosophila guanche]